MALKPTDVQGTKAYLVATSVATGTATEIKTAVSGGKQITCLLEIGDINMGTRGTTEYSCIDQDSAFKSLGSISLASITPQLLFDATDTAGQQDLIAMWDTNTRRKLILALNDQITPTTGNPTFIVFEAGISSPTIGIAKDSAVMYNPTIEIMTKPALTKAS